MRLAGTPSGNSSVDLLKNGRIHVIPQAKTMFHKMDNLERTLDRLLSRLESEDPIQQSDINQIIVAAQVQDGIEYYREKARTMDRRALRDEEHNSVRLGKHLEEKFGPRPPRCHAHAIVAGRHYLSAPLRYIMARLGIRIDDVDSGCWLPENTAATPHPAFPKAPPHSRIHRFNYYFWINSRLSSIRKEGDFRRNLKLLARMLYTGDVPNYLLLPKGANLPGGARL